MLLDIVLNIYCDIAAILQMKVPQLLGELEESKTNAERLRDSYKQLSQAKGHLEEDFRMLQEQHKMLLKKTVEEQEKKVEAEQRKVNYCFRVILIKVPFLLDCSYCSLHNLRKKSSK